MSNSPVFRRDQFSDLYGADMLPVLEELFRSDMEQHPSRRSELFRTVATERDIYQSSEIHDLPLFNEVPEGTDYSFERGKQGASKTLVIKKYGLGFSISEEAVDDGKFDMIADHVQKLARSARETQEISAMNIFNNAFTTTLTADGRPLCDTAHTLPSGLTFRNELSAPADLSVTSLEQALVDFETQFIGDSGIIYKKTPRILLVHPSNKRYAMELIGSDLKADTAENNMNSLKQDGLRVISSPHLTDVDSWFLLADPSETGLRIVSRKPVETKVAGMDAGFNSDAILYKARYREQIGALHAYGIIGVVGA